MLQRLEPLEQRRLLAGVTLTVGTDKFGGIVRIAGTGGNDDVAVTLYSKTQFQVSDGITTQQFNYADAARLTFIGGGGNDKITLGRVPLKAYLDGGAGNDSLSASTYIRDDTIVGGVGNDYCYGGPGDDRIDGGDGGDFLIGNAGDDFLQCKSEVNTDDTVSGGRGDDTVSLATYPGGTTTTIGKRNPGLQLIITDTCYGDIEHFIGSPNNDRVYDFSNRPITYDMGAGKDQVYAGLADDTITGGPGKDSLAGDAGNDTFLVADGEADSVVGGEGKDSVMGDEDLDVLKGIESDLSATT